jgi:hypothetical protein
LEFTYSVFNTKHPKTNLLNLFDVWFTLLLTQTTILLIPYLYDNINNFTGIVSTNNIFYVFLQLFTVVCSNFHGAASANVRVNSTFPMLWITWCAIIGQVFFLFAIPIILWPLLYGSQKNNNNLKKDEKMTINYPKLLK